MTSPASSELTFSLFVINIMGRRPREQPRFSVFTYNGHSIVVKYRDRDLMHKLMELNELSNVEEPLPRNALNDRPDTDILLREPSEDLLDGVAAATEDVSEPIAMPIFELDHNGSAVNWPGEPRPEPVRPPEREWTGQEDPSVPLGRLNPGQRPADSVPETGLGRPTSRWPEEVHEPDVVVSRTFMTPRVRMGMFAPRRW